MEEFWREATRTTKTHERGEFPSHGCPRGRWRLSERSPEGTPSFPALVSLGEGDSLEVQLVEPEEAASLRVVDPSGRPVPGVLVTG